MMPSARWRRWSSGRAAPGSRWPRNSWNDDTGACTSSELCALAIIVDDFKNGDAPETIQSNLSTLRLGQVFGPITFYLGNMEEVGHQSSPSATFARIWSSAARLCDRGPRTRSRRLQRKDRGSG